MWNWIQEEFYTLLIVLERYPKVWILPCVFFLFCIAVITWLNAQLGHYFETRTMTPMSPFMDHFIVSFYDKIRGKLVNRYLILGSIFLFFIGYLKYRKKIVYASQRLIKAGLWGKCSYGAAIVSWLGVLSVYRMSYRLGKTLV